jgi:hypothetical protein
MITTPTTKKRPFELQEVEIKQEVNSPLSAEVDQSYFEAGTQWLLDMLVHKPEIHFAPDSDEEHVSVNDDDGNLVGVVVQPKRAILKYYSQQCLRLQIRDVQ